MSTDQVVAELTSEINLKLVSLSGPDVKLLTEEAVRFVLQSLEDLGYQVILKHHQVDYSQAHAMGAAILRSIDNVGMKVVAKRITSGDQQQGSGSSGMSREAGVDDIEPVSILQDLATQGWIIIPPM